MVCANLSVLCGVWRSRDIIIIIIILQVRLQMQTCQRCLTSRLIIHRWSRGKNRLSETN